MRKIFSLTAACMLSTGVVHASEITGSQTIEVEASVQVSAEDSIKQAINHIFSDQPRPISATHVYDTGIAGVSEVSLSNGQLVVYLEESNTLLVSNGDVQMITKEAEGPMVNLGDRNKADEGTVLFDKLLKDGLSYKAEGEAVNAVALIDINCGHCQNLFKTASEYTDKGISLTYAPHTLSEQSEAVHKYIWCGTDEKTVQERFEAAGVTSPSFAASAETDEACVDNLRNNHKEALKLGIKGTPAFILPTGQVVRGHISPDEILRGKPQ